MAPTEYWRNVFGTDTDSTYYSTKSKNIVRQLALAAKEYQINKVAVLDFVNSEGKVPVLGEYLASRIVEEVTRQKTFRVAQRGEVEEVLTNLNLKPAAGYTTDETRRIGKALNTQALILGKITDIGSNLDVRIALIDIVSGEIIASATEDLVRSRFAVEMLRHY